MESGTFLATESTKPGLVRAHSVQKHTLPGMTLEFNLEDPRGRTAHVQLTSNTINKCDKL